MNPAFVGDQEFFNTTLRPAESDDTMGIAPLALALIGAAPSIFQSVMGIFGGGRKAQYQGLAEINAAGQQATQTMQQILSALNGGQMSPSAAVANASKVVQDFNNPQIVYPASKGQDAAARTQFIAMLNQAMQQVQALAASKAAAQSGSPAAGGSVGGISTNTLILVGGGLAALMYFKKS